MCHLICLVLESSTTELNVLSCHPCSQKSVPMHEEGLGKVGLDSDNLVMDIVIVCVVTGHELQRIPREGVTTMVVDGLQRGDGEEDHGLPSGEARAPFRDGSPQCIEEEAFDGMVIKRPESIWHVQAVMPGMEVSVEELVDVHSAVEEVLPGVDDKHGYKQLQGWDCPPVDELRHREQKDGVAQSQ